jgi:putative ABC transport system substrate-binding protein
MAAKNATQTIPIVMLAADPVGLGLVGSLSRPGGNVTGLSYLTEDIIAKRLQLLKELVPGLARVGVLKNPMDPAHPTLWKETEVAARRLGVALELDVLVPEDRASAGDVDIPRAQPTMVLHGNHRSRAFITSADIG